MIEERVKNFIKKNFKKGKVACLTGAGISAESGVPTFRGKGGLWEKYSPEIYATTMGLVSTFETAPEKIVDFLDDFYSILLAAKPNPAHLSLNRLEQLGFLSGIISQNIDNLHQDAGSRLIVELHGNAYRVKCMLCEKTIVWEKDRVKEMLSLLKASRNYKSQLFRVLSRYFPKCTCGGRFRIDVVLFGEELPKDALSEAYRILDVSDLLLVIGTSLMVYPAAQLPLYAKRQGVKIIEINNMASDFSSDLFIKGNAAVIVPELLKLL